MTTSTGETGFCWTQLRWNTTSVRPELKIARRQPGRASPAPVRRLDLHAQQDDSPKPTPYCCAAARAVTLDAIDPNPAPPASFITVLRDCIVGIAVAAHAITSAA